MSEHAAITERINKLVQDISEPYPAHGSGFVRILKPEAAQFLADALAKEAERVLEIACRAVQKMSDAIHNEDADASDVEQAIRDAVAGQKEG